MVNYISHMNGWFSRLYCDDRLHSSHIALYLALFQCWNLNRFQNPVLVLRGEIMQLSKIGSANTYTRCIKELDQWGYISYKPSYNPMKGSRVELYTFDKGDGTGNDKGVDKVLRPNKKHQKNNKRPNRDVNQRKDFNDPL